MSAKANFLVMGRECPSSVSGVAVLIVYGLRLQSA
jgi:hypothetical protein